METGCGKRRTSDEIPCMNKRTAGKECVRKTKPMNHIYTAILRRLGSTAHRPYGSSLTVAAPPPDGTPSALTAAVCTVFRLASVHLMPDPEPSTSASPSSSDGYMGLGVGIDFLRRGTAALADARGLDMVSGGGSGLRILLQNARYCVVTSEREGWDARVEFGFRIVNAPPGSPLSAAGPLPAF